VREGGFILLSQSDGDADLVAGLGWVAEVKDAAANTRVELLHALQGLREFSLPVSLASVRPGLVQPRVNLLDLVPQLRNVFTAECLSGIATEGNEIIIKPEFVAVFGGFLLLLLKLGELDGLGGESGLYLLLSPLVLCLPIKQDLLVAFEAAQLLHQAITVLAIRKVS